MTGWEVHRRRGSAAELHGGDLPVGAAPAIWVLEVDRPALVVGSTQPEADVDLGVAEEEGFEVVRRRSGGGAVLLLPGGATWVDVVLPRSHPLWEDDVSRSSRWLGEAWAGALRSLGSGEAVVHEGPMLCGSAGKVVCFAGLAAGEVTLGGAKVVGISQRRTREGARFQTVVLGAWDPDLHARLLGPGLARVGSSGEALAASPVVGLGVTADEALAGLLGDLAG